jgi:hypothetical protein
MICCVLGALFLVNIIIFGRKITHRLGIKKTVIDQEFIKTDFAGHKYFMDQFGKKIDIETNPEGSCKTAAS